MGYISKQSIPNRGLSNAQGAPETLFTTHSHQINTNQNSEIPKFICQMAMIKKT